MDKIKIIVVFFCVMLRKMIYGARMDPDPQHRAPPPPTQKGGGTTEEGFRSTVYTPNVLYASIAN